MAVLEAQIRASISNANSLFAAAPAPAPAPPATADEGPNNGFSVPKKAQDHTLRYFRGGWGGSKAKQSTAKQSTAKQINPMHIFVTTGRVSGK